MQHLHADVLTLIWNMAISDPHHLLRQKLPQRVLEEGVRWLPLWQHIAHRIECHLLKCRDIIVGSSAKAWWGGWWPQKLLLPTAWRPHWTPWQVMDICRASRGHMVVACTQNEDKEIWVGQVRSIQSRHVRLGTIRTIYIRQQPWSLCLVRGHIWLCRPPTQSRYRHMPLAIPVQWCQTI